MKYTACYSRQEIEEINPPENSVLISIRDPNSEGVKVWISDPVKAQKGWEAIAHVQFWDTSPEKPDRNRFPALSTLMPYAESWQIKMIHSFIQDFKDKNIFIHCEAGISRSAAVREYLIRRGWEYWANNDKRAVFPNNYILRSLERLDYPEREYTDSGL